MNNCIDNNVLITFAVFWNVGYGIHNQQGLQIHRIQHSVTSVLKVAGDFKWSLRSYKAMIANLLGKLKLSRHTSVSCACLDVKMCMFP